MTKPHEQAQYNEGQPLQNPHMQRPPTHRPEDYDEDDGGDAVTRVGELRFGTSVRDHEHNHPAKVASWVYLGWSKKAPGYHLWVCGASVDCPGSMINRCKKEECDTCQPPQ